MGSTQGNGEKPSHFDTSISTFFSILLKSRISENESQIFFDIRLLFDEKFSCRSKSYSARSS